MNAEHITGAALRTTQAAYESARRSGLHGADLLTVYEALRSATDAHFDAARQSSRWHSPAALQAVKVRAAARRAPAA